MRTTIIVLAVIAAGLAGHQAYHYYKSSREKKAAEANHASLLSFSKEMRTKLQEQEQVSSYLEKELATHNEQLLKTSNDLAAALSELGKKEAAAKVELNRKDAKITQLSQENSELTKRVGTLTARITELEQAVASTRQKLMASEDDRAFLLAELRRAEERTFVRERVVEPVVAQNKAKKRTRTETTTTTIRTRTGLYMASSTKGAERLVHLLSTSSQPVVK